MQKFQRQHQDYMLSTAGTKLEKVLELKGMYAYNQPKIYCDKEYYDCSFVAHFDRRNACASG